MGGVCKGLGQRQSRQWSDSRDQSTSSGEERQLTSFSFHTAGHSVSRDLR